MKGEAFHRCGVPETCTMGATSEKASIQLWWSRNVASRSFYSCKVTKKYWCLARLMHDFLFVIIKIFISNSWKKSCCFCEKSLLLSIIICHSWFSTLNVSLVFYALRNWISWKILLLVKFSYLINILMFHLNLQKLFEEVSS